MASQAEVFTAPYARLSGPALNRKIYPKPDVPQQRHPRRKGERSGNRRKEVAAVRTGPRRAVREDLVLETAAKTSALPDVTLTGYSLLK